MQTKENEVTMAVQQILDQVRRAVVGKDATLLWVLAAILARGHILLEDIPGVGKTTMALAFSKALDLKYSRVQFTPDVLPSDITGYSIVNFKTGELEYRPGMIMSQIVLADEINRTSPKTQSALLEVMEERQVTVDGVTYPLARPFMVLATQNPVDFVGTYPLPEAQMDRFFMRISIGYPTVEDEMDILARYCGASAPMQTLSAVCSAEDVLAMQQQVKGTYASPEVRAYVAAICAATRNTPYLTLGASTRAAIALVRAAQGNALLCGRDYIIPEDVQRMAAPVLCHRFVLSADARMRGYTEQQVLSELMGGVRIPVRLK